MFTIITNDLSAAQKSQLSAALARTGTASSVIVSIGTVIQHYPAVLIGQDALNYYYPGLRLDAVHGYVLDKMFIPCLSPAAIFDSPDVSHWIDLSLRKAKRLAEGQPLDSPAELIVSPTYQQVKSYLAACAASPQVCVDIETSMDTQEITAIAFALSPLSAISIPFAKQYMEDYWSPEDERDIWLMVYSLLSTKSVAKVFQNFIFDTMVLANHGLQTAGIIDDTLIIANLLNPELPKGLADLARIYCYAPPWKHMKDFNLTGDPEAFWRYNALDASKTFQIYLKQVQDLESRKLLDFYTQYVKPLGPLVYDSCTHGIAVDTAALDNMKVQMEQLLQPVEDRLAEIAEPYSAAFAKQVKKRNKEKDVKGPSPKTGKQIVIEKGYDFSFEPFNPRSPEQVKELLRVFGYRIPTYRGKETTDRNALLKLNRKKPDEFITLLLRHGKLAKLKSSYLSLALDRDGRCHYSYNIGGTRSGRFSCQATSWGTGLNIQTIPRRSPDVPFNIKDCFVPDQDHVLVEVDLSQAELRVVAWLAREEKLIDLMERNEDVHQYTADQISKISNLICPRQLGKRINHASNYGMGPGKFADSCLLEADLVISVVDAATLLNARQKTFPAIYGWQRSIEDTIRRTRRLVSPHGRERYFYGIPNDEMFREALSFIPQATVVDTLNAAWIALSRNAGYNVDFRVLAQIHDSLLISVKADKLDWLKELINVAFRGQSLDINGYNRIIPWDIKVLGNSWGGKSVD